MSANKVGRRGFLRLSAMAAAGAAVVACQPQTVVVKETVQVEKVVKETVEVEKVVKETVEVEKAVTAVVEKEVTKIVEKLVTPVPAPLEVKEAPAITELVQSGALPPLSERLPRDPFVVGPGVLFPEDRVDWVVGRYGGTLRMAQPDPEWNPDIFLGAREGLLETSGVNGIDSLGNVVKGFDISDGGRVITFQMREGLKYSDGEPVTVEDVMFNYEDILLNEQLTPAFPQWMRSANTPTGEPVQIERLDDYSFRVSFTEPYGGILAWASIIGWKGYTDWLVPKHFMSQYHVDYTPLEDLEPQIAEEGLAAGEWWTLFSAKNTAVWDLTRSKSIGFPRLYPWLIVELGQLVARYERNPYYHKVDIEGQQLPYIDGIESQIVQDVEVVNLKVLAGEIDYLREDAGTDKLSLYKENEEAGGYRVQLYPGPTAKALGNQNNIRFNLTYENEVWREVVRDIRFRRAVVHSLNVPAIIEAILFGFGEPEEMVGHEYNPDKANQILDEMGLDQRDGDGFRLGSDGETFEVPFEIAEYNPTFVPITELIVEYMNAVGIKTTMKVIDAGLASTRMSANETQASIMWDHRGAWWGWGGPFGSGDIHVRTWPLWWNWHTSAGEQGEEPPEEVEAWFQLLDASVVVSPSDSVEIVEQYRSMYSEYIWFIEMIMNSKHPIIASCHQEVAIWDLF